MDRFEELLSELIVCYLKENPYAKFEMPNRTKVKVPYSSSSKSVYKSSDLEVARWHICSFLNKFFVDLKKVEVNLNKKDPQTVFLSLKQGKLTSEIDDKRISDKICRMMRHLIYIVLHISFDFLILFIYNI